MFQGGHIIFFQSLSLLGYCLFPLDVGALICMLKDNVVAKVIIVCLALAWSSWAAYPFMSSAVNPNRKALALYPVLLMYLSVGFLIIAIDWSSFPSRGRESTCSRSPFSYLCIGSFSHHRVWSLLALGFWNEFWKIIGECIIEAPILGVKLHFILST